MRKQLQVLGFWDFVECETAAKAASDLEVDASIGLVISDFHIASGSGLEFLHWIRTSSNERISSVPFILVTGDTDRSTVFACAQYGVQGILQKPLGLEALSAKLKLVLGASMPVLEHA